jgi:hypothetical protein
MIHHGSDGDVPSSSKNIPKHNENVGACGKKDIGKKQGSVRIVCFDTTATKKHACPRVR